MKVIFIVFCVYAVSLFFREEHIPGSWIIPIAEHFLGDGYLVHLDSVSIGFRRGIKVRTLRLYDQTSRRSLQPVLSATSVEVNPFQREIKATDLVFSRLGDSYYAPGNTDRNEEVEAEFPDLGRFRIVLVNPNVLGVHPARVECDLEMAERRLDFANIRLDWPDREERMALDGFCYLDLERQEVYGEVKGLATQAQIRPLLVTLDVPVSLPYMDAFTEVPKPVPSFCAWKVNLVNSDFDLWLDLKPTLGKYNGVSMKGANGKIHVHNFTRDNKFNYVTTVGPIEGRDIEDRPLDGTVVIVGTNGNCKVDVTAKSAQPLADVLKIGGFTGEYVGKDVFGKSECELQFRFPRAMSNNYEVLNGYGHVKVKEGQLMRMRFFSGMIAAMPAVAPAVTWLSDATQASADYTIENGVIKSDNIYIEGSCFSIRMSGKFDATKDALDFKVLVQFAKKDSWMGKLLHPLTWPFSKLLLEFRLKGTADKPKWSYISVVDRVIDAVK